MAVSVIIPTWKAKKYIQPLVQSLWMQSLKPLEIIVIDSSSGDGTPELAQQLSCQVEVIPQAEFNHGGTRNLGASMARGDILVFMTQDALPKDEHFLANLTQSIRLGEVAAAYACQIPYPDAPALEVFARAYNYPNQSQRRTAQDIPRLGIKAFFFSDVASSVSREVFDKVGGFPTHTIMNEDMYFCAELLRAGFVVEYQAGATVLHSHNYTLLQTFRRYFDIGVFIRQSAEGLGGARAGGEGVRYVLEQLRFLAARREWTQVPLAFAEAATKFVAYQMGRREHFFSNRLKRRLSMHPHYWKDLV